MNEFCFHVLKAAREASGPPDEVTGRYFADIAARIDLARYFSDLEQLSRQPRDGNTLARYSALFDQDASCVLSVAFTDLLRGPLALDQRAMIEAVRTLEDWAVRHGS